MNQSQSRDIILMSTADWSHPFWTNKQHTALALVKLGYRVLYIDTLGSRKIRLGQRSDLKRIWARFKKLFAKPKAVQPNLWVWSPCVLPVSNSSIMRWFNQRLFSWILKYWTKKIFSSTKPIFWTYNPLTLLYISSHHYAQLIYHCVDNIAEQPGAHAALIKQWETQLFKKSDIVFVTARALEQHAQQYNQHVYYHPNVVDYAHFIKALQDIAEPADMVSIPHPRAGFIGAISAYKLNLKLIYDVASKAHAISFVLIGAVGEGDPDTSVSQLQQLPNVYFLGPKSYAELPHYLKGLDVCLIPANLNEYTKAMFPMKFFEYLAGAKPIVATNIAAINEYHSFYLVAHDANEFASQIQMALTTDDKEKQQARLALAAEHTYLSRTEKMLTRMGEVRKSL